MRSAIKPSVTLGIVATMVVGFLIAWGSGFDPRVLSSLVCDGSLNRFYTFLIYPLAPTEMGAGVLFLVLEWLWLYWIGTSLEREEGAGRMAAIYAVSILVGSISMVLGGVLLNRQIAVGGPLLPVSALTCLWGARNQNARVMLMMVVPVSGKILAIVTAVLAVIAYGSGAPLLGLFALIPCALGWFFGIGAFRKRAKTVVTGRGPARSTEEFDQFVEKVRAKEKERKDQERLRKLLEAPPTDESLDDR